MKIGVPNCPECNSPARGTVETQLACAEFEQNSDGTLKYSGWTENLSDEQETNRNKKGQIELICDNQHRWFSKMEEI
jgi:hypothetical protein